VKRLQCITQGLISPIQFNDFFFDFLFRFHCFPLVKPARFLRSRQVWHRHCGAPLLFFPFTSAGRRRHT
jgi:hypothetical protein